MSRSQCEKLIKDGGTLIAPPRIMYYMIRFPVGGPGNYGVRVASRLNRTHAAAMRSLAKQANRLIIAIEGRP